MSNQNPLRKARSHLTFITGLSLAASLVMWADSRPEAVAATTSAGVVIAPSADRAVIAPSRPLTRTEMQAARTAWTYFTNNTQAATGWANATNNFPSSTLWDQASYMLGTMSAAKLGLIERSEASARLERVLDSAARLPLFDGTLPNKVYDTRSLEMTDYSNTPVPRGIGWSALDIARFYVPLIAVTRDYPELSPKVQSLLTGWDLDQLTKDGFLTGARVSAKNGGTERVQEGRLGYEEYAARAATLLGLDALEALRYEDQTTFVHVNGYDVGLDIRSLNQRDTHNYIVSEPYLLTEFEFGLDYKSSELAWRVFAAQKSRFESEGILTAVSEDHIDQAPYFIYYSIYGAGRRWAPMAEDGTLHLDMATVSSKSAWGWNMIYEDAYSNLLVESMEQAQDPQTGWFAGLYEEDGRVNAVATANTNGIILEALAYKQFGPLLKL